MIVSRSEIETYLGLGASITDAQRTLIEMLHPGCEAVVRRFLRYNPEYGQRIEFLPQVPANIPDYPLEDPDYQHGKVWHHGQVVAGQELLQLTHVPVWVEDIEVREDPGAQAGQTPGSFGDSTILTLGVDYFVDEIGTGYSMTGQLRRCGAWPAEARSVKVTYNAGWRDSDFQYGDAADLRDAVLVTIASEYWKQRRRKNTEGAGDISSESIGDYSYSTRGTSAELLSGVIKLLPEVEQSLSTYRNWGLP